MNNSKKILSLAQQVYKQGTRSATTEAFPKSYGRFKAVQAKFEIPDETPIHIKGGLTDKLLVRTTWALCILGTAAGLQVFYKLALGRAD